MTSQIQKTQKQINKQISYKERDQQYRRNHPLRENWDDWQSIVAKFYSPGVKKLQKSINKAYRLYDTSEHTILEGYVIDEIYFLSNAYHFDLLQIKNKENFYEFSYQMFKKGDIFSRCWNREGDTTFECVDCVHEHIDLFNNDCIFKLEHLQSHILAFMWSLYYIMKKKERKRFRKYYERLERIVLSLPYDRLKFIDFDCIFRPAKFVMFKNSLLITLYERFHLDGWTGKHLKDLPVIFEYLKNLRLPKQQSGRVTNQCFSDVPLFSSDLIELLYDISKNNSFDKIAQVFTIHSQGLMSLNHNLEISDSSVQKLKDMLTESKDSFMESMRESLLCVGEKLGAMFIIAATCSLLSRLMVSCGVKLVLKMLHTIYLFVTGGLFTQEIKESLAVSQSGSEISIPFLPTIILNNIIKPPKDILNRIWKSPNIDIVMRRIGFLGDVKIERGIERIVEWIKDLIRKVQQWYGQDILGMCCGIQGLFESEENPVLVWMREVDEISSKYFQNEFRWTDMEFQIIYGYYKKGLGLCRNNEFIKYKNDIHRILRQLVSIMEKFKQKGINNQTIRNPPVTIYIYGDTGVGKSSITYPLAVEILKRIHDQEGSSIDLKREWKNMIYMRAPEQEYWDGYENQLVTVFDDFSQQTDSLQNPNVELFEIIRSSNCFPYPLHMASLEQKANTNFTSKIIIVSSNLKSPQCASLNFPEALKRRFDLSIQIKRKYEGHTNKFDPTLYQLEKFDMMTGSLLGANSYNEFVDDCVNAYFSRKNFVSTIESYIDSIFDASNEVVQQDQIPLSQGGGLELSKQSSENLPDLEQSTNQPSSQQIVQQMLESDLQKFVDARIGQLLEIEARQNGIEPGLFKANINRINNDRWISEIEAEERLNNKFKNPFYLISYYISKTTEKASSAMSASWKLFKEKHAYLKNAMITISLIGIGLTFIKIFFSISKMVKGETETSKVRPSRSEKGLVKAESLVELMDKVPKKESYTGTVPKVAKIESYVPPMTRVAKIESYTMPQAKVARVEGPVIPNSEGVKDINATEILLKIVRSNMYKMYESTRNTTIGHVIFIKGKIAVMPKHFLSAFYQSMRNDPEASLCFENVFLDRSFSIKVKDMLATKQDFESPSEEEGPVMTRDLMCFSIKTSIYHSDATNYFVTKGSMSRVDASEIMLPILMANNHKDSSKACLLVRYARGQSQLECVERLPVADEEDIVARYIRNAYMYNLDTQETECGAPLIVRNTLIQPGKICGIHIAGIAGTGQGWSTVIYKEDVVKIINMFEQCDAISVDFKNQLTDFPKEQGRIPEDSQFIRLGKYQQCVSQPRKSKIVPSPLFGKIKEVTTRPCLLTTKIIDGEIFDPREYRLKRLGNVPVCLSEDMIECVKDALIDEISTVIVKNKDSINENCKSKYTFEEACLGIEGENYINAVKRDTSTGFPYVFLKDFTRKDIFGHNEEYSLESRQCEILRRRVENIIEDAKQGIAQDHVFIDTLKDERKPIEKAHKTRLFSAGPIDYLIVCKMYYNGIVNLLSKNRNRCHVSVGTNVYSHDWNEIVKILHNKSKKIVAGDFEGFDASQHQRLLEASLEVLIELSKRFLGSTEEDVMVMKTLNVGLVNSVHVMEDLIYQWTHSLPSGHYLTAIINSIFVNIAFGCCFCLYKKKVSYKTARTFWNKCGIVAYGDDHLVSVPLSEEDFNQFTIPKFMSKLGLSYTLEDKDSQAMSEFRSIQEVTYLKRSFLFDKDLNRYICPLNLNTVLEFPMWNHRCPDPIAQTIVELEKCLEELSLHSEEVWNKHIDKLIECGRYLGYYTDKINQKETRLLALGQVELI